MAKWIKTEVRRQIADAITPLVSSAGFKYKKSASAFVRRIDGGRQELNVSIADYNPEFHFSLPLVIRLDAVQEITNSFSGSPAKYHDITVTTITQMEHLGLPFNQGKSFAYRVKSESEFVSILPQVLDFVRNKVVPYFERYTTISAVNAGLNPPNAEHDAVSIPWPPDARAFDASNYPYRAMTAVVVAHLANDPRFASLVSAYRGQIRQCDEEDRQKFENAVLHLRGSV